MSNKTYDLLKWIALVFLPAFTTFYGVVGTTFAIPYTQEVLTILVAFDTFLGTLLGVNSAKYKSKNNIDDSDDGK